MFSKFKLIWNIAFVTFLFIFDLFYSENWFKIDWTKAAELLVTTRGNLFYIEQINHFCSVLFMTMASVRGVIITTLSCVNKRWRWEPHKEKTLSFYACKKKRPTHKSRHYWRNLWQTVLVGIPGSLIIIKDTVKYTVYKHM